MKNRTTPKRVIAALVIVTVVVTATLAVGPASAHEPDVRTAPQMLEEVDCTGDAPIVVASDPAAQSDIYSAVTLAGVLGTDCIIDAGARTAAISRDQLARLAESDVGSGYVVGGASAVPDSKHASIVGMTRVGGADRFATAQLIGRAALDIADAAANAPRSTQSGTGSKVVKISANHGDTVTLAVARNGDDRLASLSLYESDGSRCGYEGEFATEITLYLVVRSHCVPAKAEIDVQSQATWTLAVSD